MLRENTVPRKENFRKTFLKLQFEKKLFKKQKTKFYPQSLILIFVLRNKIKKNPKRLKEKHQTPK